MEQCKASVYMTRKMNAVALNVDIEIAPMMENRASNYVEM